MQDVNGRNVPYSQTDDNWKNYLWYDPKVKPLFRKITECLHKYEKEGSHGKSLLNAMNKLNDKIIEIVNKGEYKHKHTNEGSMHESGCWHMSIANMLAIFKIKLDGRLADPITLLWALKEHNLGSLTGFVEHSFVDPLSLITKDKVQLVKYRSFGAEGVGKKNKALLGLLNEIDENTCAIVNVGAHEFQSSNTDDCHYVLLPHFNEGDYCAIDTNYSHKINLFDEYDDKIHQVSLYQCFR